MPDEDLAPVSLTTVEPASSAASQPLDPLRLPLHGSRLIEASAGTGKTWTIAALYLRLVLGHGDEHTRPPLSAQTGSRALAPSEILVMTFTRAATRELAGRIRERLQHAARCFRGDFAPDPKDHFLCDLMAAYAEGTPREAAAWRLALAAESMDDAAVHTIDAWCQRMLKEHAFDSAQWFDEELLADEAALRTQAVQDLWRREVVPLTADPLDAVLAIWPTVEHLQQQVEPLVALEALQTAPGNAATTARLEEVLSATLGERRMRLAALKSGWTQRVTTLRNWLDREHAAGRFNGSKLRPGYYEGWLDALQAWADDPLQEHFDLKTGATRLTHAGLHDALKTGPKAPATPFEIPDEIDALDALMPALLALPNLREALLRHAASAVQQRLAELKQRQGRFGFADLQIRLDRALSGAHGERLRTQIRAQTPVALIDEFQDTSPLQYRLFDRLYGVAADDPATGLLLIGDPKQAIYSFRGADIYSYLQARADTAGRHHVLDTNFRSTEALVSAVNTVFERAENRWPGGAFGFDRSSAKALPFEPVKARGRAERFVDNGAPLAALQVQLLPEPLKAPELRRRLARHAAAQIVRWLNDPGVGFEVAAEDGVAPGWRRLSPGDVAVLVRSRVESDALRAELRLRGVASVYLSDQESVFQSLEAQDLLRWLKAVSEPLNAELVRNAYATRLAGLRLDQMAALLHDEAAWEARVGLLLRLRGVWQRQGALTLVRQTLHALDLPARCLGEAAGAAGRAGGGSDGGAGAGAGSAAESGAGAGGERRLTNLLHLGELMQQASDQLDGEQAQLRWLAEEIAGSRQGGAEERVVRLESDAQLVQVVTVHKSKGLEYPVVFLPFAASARPVSKRGRSHVEQVDEATGARHLDFAMGKDALERADQERLREDLRLMYVALTRARHALWLGVGLTKARNKEPGANALHRSALGYLLGGGAALPGESAEVALSAWAQASPDIQLQRLQGYAARDRLDRGVAPPALGLALRKTEAFDRDWSVGSFSGLVRDLSDNASTASAAVPTRTTNTPSSVRTTRTTRTTSAASAVNANAPFSSGGLAFESSPTTSPLPAPMAGGDAVFQERLQELFQAEEGAEDQRSAPHFRAGVQRSSESVASPQVNAHLAPWHQFPRGALAGNFLHDVLEMVCEDGFASIETTDMQNRLHKRCERDGHGERAEGVIEWLRALLATPLPGLEAPLSALDTVLPEMEFWMPSLALRSEALDAICRAHCWAGQARPALVPRELQGLLMGFADLVVEHEGRWWVMDYKSNALAGTDAADADAAYHADALRDAMLAHRYELQAAIYLLALHRLLRTRLGAAYDPAQHLGGAVYLFLRGFRGPQAGCVVLPARPDWLAALDACLSGAESEEVTP